MSDVQPHEQGQRPIGWVTCLKCGARTRSGRPCAAPAIQGKKRCRLHGGLSTGPQTAEGLKRLIFDKLKHGRRSKYFRAALRQAGIAATSIEASLLAAELRLQGAQNEEQPDSEKVADVATP